MNKQFETKKELKDYLSAFLPIKITNKITIFNGEILITEELHSLLRGYLGTSYYPATNYRLSVKASWSWSSLLMNTSLLILVETQPIDNKLTKELLEHIINLD